MFHKTKNVRTVLILMAVIFFPLFLHAQQENKDSLGMLNENLNNVIVDSAAELPYEVTTGEGGYNGDQAAMPSKYFLRKDLQSHGGGPDSVYMQRLPDSVIAEMRNDDEFWYVNAVFEKKEKKKKEESYTPISESALFQTILWLVIIGGFAAFVIIYLSNSNVSLFRKKNIIIHSDEELELDTDNIFEINYRREIDKAVAAGNFRFAVRLMFLQALKNLSEKNIIQYKPDRTNFDYLLQLHTTGHYSDFFRLTRNYEYSWYGQFDIDKEKFVLIRNDFENFDNKLKY